MSAIFGPNYRLIIQKGAITPSRRIDTKEKFSKPITPGRIITMPFSRGGHTVHGK